MKSLSLFVSVAALLSASSAFALDCGTLPTCESLGYNDIVAQCPKSVNGEDLAVKCPFDTSKGKCMYEAAVGQIGYFTKAPNANSGWLLCDGKTYSIATYPQLAKFIATQFGGTSGNTFNVPNYQGYFLRVYGTPNSTYGQVGNTSLTSPQKEGLPNITGKFGLHSASGVSGVFARASGSHECIRNGDCTESGVSFSASASNTIYGSSSGVTPPNYAVYAYIYAGKVVK